MLHYSETMKEINLITIGLQIRRIRKDKNLSLQEIANRTGLSKSLMSKVENFRTIPSLPVLLKISDALNVDMAELVKGINKKHDQNYWMKIAKKTNGRPYSIAIHIILALHTGPIISGSVCNMLTKNKDELKDIRFVDENKRIGDMKLSELYNEIKDNSRCQNW